MGSGIALTAGLSLEGATKLQPRRPVACSTRPEEGNDMTMNIRVCTGSVVIALAICSVVAAQEKKITRPQLPAAVEKTVARESQGATINGFATEIENGKRLYEVELTVDSHSKDISMDKNGNIVEIEEEVA